MKTSVSSSSIQEEKPVHEEVKKEVSAGTASISRISPAAKMLISEHGLDISSLKASGSHGTLLKGDVLAAIRSGKASPKPSAKETSSHKVSPKPATTTGVESRPATQLSDSFEDLPNSQIRKVYFLKLLNESNSLLAQCLPLIKGMGRLFSRECIMCNIFTYITD